MTLIVWDNMSFLRFIKEWFYEERMLDSERVLRSLSVMCPDLGNYYQQYLSEYTIKTGLALKN